MNWTTLAVEPDSFYKRRRPVIYSRQIQNIVSLPSLNKLVIDGVISFQPLLSIVPLVFILGKYSDSCLTICFHDLFGYDHKNYWICRDWIDNEETRSLVVVYIAHTTVKIIYIFFLLSPLHPPAFPPEEKKKRKGNVKY